ncbi:terpenoid synthase [Schizopora paradoxa]|uniref:Terpene synthase n=1 Tax=Schizopora paradoxa TaxID=27342 RepID=A0A0H2R9X6_9AGAM|nr:terpenoid synthase [Schizopora paradoxa]
MPGPRQFTLPDLTTIVPFAWSSNPHYSKASADSASWINSFDILNGDETVKYKRAMLELLASYMFPYAGFEELRTCCDFINMITSLDDFSDLQDGEGAQQSTDTFLAAISGKPAKATDLYRMVSQFRERYARKAGANCMRRFVENCENYCAAVAKEAELRDLDCTLDIDSFTKLRREYSATQLCVGLFEYVHGIDLPDAVFDDDVFRLVYWAGVDMLCLTNDLYSFNREQAKGIATNNMFTVVMKERGYTYQQAADYIGEEHQRLVAQLVDASANMPSFGKKVDDGVQKYVYSMEQGVVGNVIWCLETPRYFGVWNEPLQRDRRVKLWDVVV